MGEERWWFYGNLVCQKFFGFLLESNRRIFEDKLKIVNFYGTRLTLGIASGFRYLVNGDLNVFHSRRESGSLMIMVFCGIFYWDLYLISYSFFMVDYNWSVVIINWTYLLLKKRASKPYNGWVLSTLLGEGLKFNRTKVIY